MASVIWLPPVFVVALTSSVGKSPVPVSNTTSPRSMRNTVSKYVTCPRVELKLPSSVGARRLPPTTTAPDAVRSIAPPCTRTRLPGRRRHVEIDGRQHEAGRRRTRDRHARDEMEIAAVDAARIRDRSSGQRRWHAGHRSRRCRRRAALTEAAGERVDRGERHERIGRGDRSFEIWIDARFREAEIAVERAAEPARDVDVRAVQREARRSIAGRRSSANPRPARRAPCPRATTSPDPSEARKRESVTVSCASEMSASMRSSGTVSNDDTTEPLRREADPASTGSPALPTADAVPCNVPPNRPNLPDSESKDDKVDVLSP